MQTNEDHYGMRRKSFKSYGFLRCFFLTRTIRGGYIHDNGNFLEGDVMKYLARISVGLAGILAMFGINAFTAFATPQKMPTTTVTNVTPLYLELGANVSDSQRTQTNALLTFHYSHGSHGSHYSHASHASHYSRYR